MSNKEQDEDALLSDYMRDDWNVSYVALPDNDGLLQFFDSRSDVVSNGRYVTSIRVSEAQAFFARSQSKEHYISPEGVRIPRKRLENAVAWAQPRIEQQERKRIADPSALLSQAMHRIAVSKAQAPEKAQAKIGEQQLLFEPEQKKCMGMGA